VLDPCRLQSQFQLFIKSCLNETAEQTVRVPLFASNYQSEFLSRKSNVVERKCGYDKTAFQWERLTSFSYRLVFRFSVRYIRHVVTVVTSIPPWQSTGFMHLARVSISLCFWARRVSGVDDHYDDVYCSAPSLA
jgi:hypothetical protein